MTSRITEGNSDGDRAESLKLRSVLYDRTTGLPTYPLLFDRLRDEGTPFKLTLSISPTLAKNTP